MDIKKLSAAGCAAILALTLGACGNTSASNDKNHSTDHASAAKAAGEKFTIGFDPNFPPYGYKDEKTGEYVGFDIDLAKEVAKRNEWKFVPQPIDWDAKDMELNSGTVDCLWNGFTINGREDKYTWSKPYVDNSIVFVTKTADKITDTKGLAGKHVLVQADSSGLTALENKDNKDLKDSFASLDQVPDYNQAFMNMESGAADAVAVDVGVANFQVQAHEKGKFTIMNPPFHTEQYGIGFKKGNESLRDQVQKALDEMKADGTFMKLAEKHAVEKSVIKD
ncbi:ABC transporter, substrate-binding protein, family 3 [Mobiluncus mulieris FB024-16]|uniref:amino acid ABC transporter substrate-binding protein n=1 Tax=Mobiluncus mulieris TaxID=2052 RepID=UPI0001E51960|nr:amino acid ABC transporter substrate-binding protein [Mobiluncus mulieris]EFN93343.1 ABC transporter, substrate-binding protein, family 3 [Mobiluncus mulieris FB024-16]